MVLLLLGTLALAWVPLPRASAQGAEIIVGPDETLDWVGVNRTIDGRVTVLGRLNVKDSLLRYNITTSGDASFWVRTTGQLTFENTTLLALNRSAYFFFKVEGRFVAHGSALFHLSGAYYTGGGIKCVGGTVELQDTNVTDCESMAISVEGDAGSATAERCHLQGKQYGITAKDGASISVRNTTIDGFTNMGVTVSNATCDIYNSWINSSTESTVAKGVGARAAHLDMTGTTVSHCRSDAIELVENTTGELKDCELHHCTVGLRITGVIGDLQVRGCSIHHNLDGINIYKSSDVRIEQCTLVGNVNGIASKDCEGGYSLSGDRIGNNSQLGAYVVGKGFAEEGTTWTDVDGFVNAEARVKQMWSLDLQVNDTSGRPVSGAEIAIKSPDGTVFNYTTNSFGKVGSGIVLEGNRITNNGTRLDAGGYKVTIKLGLVEAKKTVVMDRDKELIVILGEVEKVSPLRTPLGMATIALIVIAIICGAAYWYIRLR
jgi:nitrous oxidase accessory protein NosD